MEINWGELGKELGKVLLESVKGVLEGAEGDLREWGEAIVKDLVVALQSGDDDLRRELVAQSRAVAELSRLRAVNGQWALLERVVDVVMHTAMRVLSPAVFRS